MRNRDALGLVLSLAALALLAGLVYVLFFRAPEVSPLPPAVPAPDSATAEQICFLALGRQGYGNEPTKRIAKAMERLARQQPTHFVVLAGDNFYPRGVSSVGDSQWQTNFERQYSGTHLRGMPFFAVAGNHDHAGNIDAQLEYARRRLGTGRWQMDALHYCRDFGRHGDRVLLRIVFLDTEALQTGPEPQEGFLRSAMAAPGQPVWRVVVAHDPCRSLTNNDFSRQRVLRTLLPVVREARVAVYLSANDRFQQMLQRPTEPLHVSTNGGGGKIEADIVPRNSETDFVAPQRGFARVRVDAKALTIELLNTDGVVSYQKTLNR